MLYRCATNVVPQCSSSRPAFTTSLRSILRRVGIFSLLFCCCADLFQSKMALAQLKELCESEAKALGSGYDKFTTLVYTDLSHFEKKSFLEEAFAEGLESQLYDNLVKKIRERYQGYHSGKLNAGHVKQGGIDLSAHITAD